MDVLTALGADEKHIYYDKFTTTGSSLTRTNRDVYRRGDRDDRRGAQLHRSRSSPTPRPAPRCSRTRRRAATTTSRPQKRKQSHYEDVTVEVQPDPRHYLSQGWLYGFSDGRGGYPLDWTALKAWGSDRPGARALPRLRRQGLRLAGARLARVPRPERGVGAHVLPLQLQRRPADQRRTSRPPGRPRRSSSGTRTGSTFVERNVGAWMHVEHGLGLYVFANANRRAPTNMHNNAISVNSMHRIRFAQDLALYNLTLSEEIEGFDGAAHVETVERPTRPGRACAGRRAADRDRRLGRGRLRRQHRLRAAGRRAVPQPAGAAGGAGQRRLRHPDGGRRRRVRLRRARPALHEGDVRAADQRQGVRRPQHGILDQWLSTWTERCITAARELQPLWSQPDAKPPRFEDGLDRAKNRFSGILSDLSLQSPKELTQ